MPGSSDFNGDGRDDLLWRNSDGTIGYWFGEADGGFTINPTLTHVPSQWRVGGTGDFNGDGQDDILWRHADGTVGYWFGRVDGNFSINSQVRQVSGAWEIAGTGDFNGDGQDDILWRHDDGRVGTWLGQADGGFTNGIEIAVPNDWVVEGAGDFDGDGRADILWWNYEYLGIWTGTATGFDIRPELTFSNFGVSGIADFNGDGRDDVVMNDAWSLYSVAYSQPGGRFQVDPDEDYLGGFGDDRLRSIGDFDGDGRADAVFRDSAGALTVGNFEVVVPTNWHLPIDLAIAPWNY
jgi:hypothetical protein